jgi:hypothetical protein
MDNSAVPQKEQLEKFFADIEATNQVFMEADLPTKRVMLAKDVITQLDIKRMTAYSTYFTPLAIETVDPSYYHRTDWTFFDRNLVESSRDMKDAMRSMPMCQVCGIGSLFVAAVQRLDKMRVADYSHYRATHTSYLRKHELFSDDESDHIEAFFENYNFSTEHKAYRTNGWDCATPTDRLRRIMETIVETEGKEKLTVALFTAKKLEPK